MRKVYIVHGWGGASIGPQISWIKERAEKKGFAAYALAMPDTENPVIERWVNKLREVVEGPDQNTYFIGHSIGGQAIMRYLVTLPEHTRIGGVIFLAGWFVLNNLEDAEAEKTAQPWVETPIDFGLLKKKTDKYVAIL
ncbi:alpha/beta hydrolase [Candidatus Uhrbacteria bacterium]|nr:alpha/beta hydrolase [Candidatus Uhrbacteria bacterium]